MIERIPHITRSNSVEVAVYALQIGPVNSRNFPCDLVSNYV